ncbi:hypothetical protein ARTHRO9V_150097 [Arthrobacter sp. 9V]|nr:hypothetical protein ARTHRO9V_150097 [Arthrobacter sp. 9V]
MDLPDFLDLELDGDLPDIFSPSIFGYDNTISTYIFKASYRIYGPEANPVYAFS